MKKKKKKKNRYKQKFFVSLPGRMKNNNCSNNIMEKREYLQPQMKEFKSQKLSLLAGTTEDPENGQSW